MCNAACIGFGETGLSREDVFGKKVIEVGAYDVNGSLRKIIERHEPESYVGVDIAEGPGVDELCDINDLVTRYGEGSFDVVVTTELMEHVRDWRSGVSNLKRILRPGGVLLLTTRSKGFPYHGYPNDWWRYELEDMKVIFSDLDSLVVQADPLSPGVFVRGVKQAGSRETDLKTIGLYSMIRLERCHDVGNLDVRWFRLKHWLRTRGRYVLRRITGR